MTTWFVTRHPGAVEWATRQGLRIDRHVAHLDPAIIAPGDTVIGILPVNLAARVCERGARYFNLSLELPAEARGRELSADELERYGARLEAYVIHAATTIPAAPEPMPPAINDAAARHPDPALEALGGIARGAACPADIRERGDRT
jgi:CRISPR-associated protein Csx16